MPQSGDAMGPTALRVAWSAVVSIYQTQYPIVECATLEIPKATVANDTVKADELARHLISLHVSVPIYDCVSRMGICSSRVSTFRPPRKVCPSSAPRLDLRGRRGPAGNVLSARPVAFSSAIYSAAANVHPVSSSPPCRTENEYRSGRNCR